MGYRLTRTYKRGLTGSTICHTEAIIERLKKIRALNTNPSVFGIDNLLKRTYISRTNSSIRS